MSEVPVQASDGSGSGIIEGGGGGAYWHAWLTSASETESRTPNSEFQIPKPESRIQTPESRNPSSARTKSSVTRNVPGAISPDRASTDQSTFLRGRGVGRILARLVDFRERDRLVVVVHLLDVSEALRV